MAISTQNTLSLALIPGRLEGAQQQVQNHGLIREIAGNLITKRNCVYMGTALTVGFAGGALYTSGLVSLGLATLSVASGGLTTLVAKNLHQMTAQLQVYANIAIADMVSYSAM